MFCQPISHNCCNQLIHSTFFKDKIIYIYIYIHTYIYIYIYMCVCVCVYVCYPLCEIQAKVSQSYYEITSIKMLFQPFISLSFQSLTWPYFSQNVLYHMKDDFFCCCRKQQITKITKKFSQWGSHIYTIINCDGESNKIFPCSFCSKY